MSKTPKIKRRQFLAGAVAAGPVIAASAGRICGFHVSDWLVPLPDVLLGRGMMGDGVIDIRSLRDAVDRAGYVGPIEVEILNQAIWDEAPDSVLDRVVETFESFV